MAATTLPTRSAAGIGPMWSYWYHGISHLSVWKGGYRGAGSDVATLHQFPFGFSVWIYNTHDEHLFTKSDENTHWFREGTSAAALRKVLDFAEKRLGVRGNRTNLLGVHR